MVAILAQVLFSFSGRGGGSAMARVLFPLRAQIGTLSSGARLSFLLHLFLEIECGFLDNLGPFVCLQLDMAGSKDVIDRVLLKERHKQAGTLALSFPWEQGIFKEILGNTAGLPALPVVEVPLDLPSSSAATLDDFVQVARAAAVTEATNVAHYRLAVERATWRACSKLSVGEQITLVCQKFDLILAHDYNCSVVGRTIKGMSSTAQG